MILGFLTKYRDYRSRVHTRAQVAILVLFILREKPAFQLLVDLFSKLVAQINSPLN